MAHHAVRLALVTACALLAAPVLAQTSPAPAAPAPAPAPAAKPGPGAAPGRAHIAVEQRIDRLRSDLKITPDETKAFDDFAQVMRDNANRMDALIKDSMKDAGKMTAVEHMKAYEVITQARADDMQRAVPAFSHLYDVLTPEQKKLADESFSKAAMGRPPR